MAGYILLGILLLIVLLAAVLLIRTAVLKPTPAKTAQVKLQDNDRVRREARADGQKRDRFQPL